MGSPNVSKYKWVAFNEHLLHACPYSKCFLCFDSLNPLKSRRRRSCYSYFADKSQEVRTTKCETTYLFGESEQQEPQFHVPDQGFHAALWCY